MKDHLDGTHRNVAPCVKVPEDVKNGMKDYMNKGVIVYVILYI